MTPHRGKSWKTRSMRLGSTPWTKPRKTPSWLSSASWRILFAFDRKRRAVLLVGGNKGPTGKRWYDVNVPIAVQRAKRHGIG